MNINDHIWKLALQKSIPEVTESQNTWDGKHWSIKRGGEDSDKNLWANLVAMYIGKRLDNPYQGLAVLKVVRVGKRFLDDSNVPSGCKYLIDAIQDLGFLQNDSRYYTRILFDQRKCVKGEEPHMEITLWYPLQS